MVTRRQYSDNDKAAALAALDANGGNVRGTAKQLKLSHATLQRWSDRRTSQGSILPPAEDFTDKERMFIAYYVAHLNGTKAARLAQYEGDDATLGVTSHRLLKNAKIRAEVDRLLSEKVMGANETLIRLSEHARGDMGDFINIDFSAEAARHPMSRLIKKFKRTSRNDKDDGLTITVELELYDAQAALEKLGRYHALFTDKTEHSGSIGWAQLFTGDADGTPSNDKPAESADAY